MKQYEYAARAYQNEGGMITLIVDAGYPDRNVYGGFEQMPDGELLRRLQVLSLDPIADENEGWDSEFLSPEDIDEIEDGDQLIAEVTCSGDIIMYTHRMGYAARKALAYPPEQD